MSARLANPESALQDLFGLGDRQTEFVTRKEQRKRRSRYGPSSVNICVTTGCNRGR
jgi:hypothetical protein